MNHSINISNEYSALKKVVLCRPATHNPENDDEAKALNFRGLPSYQELQDAHSALGEALLKYNIQVFYLDEHLTEEEKRIADFLPNRVFVRDTAGIMNDRICLGYPSFQVRTAEFFFLQNALKRILTSEIVKHEKIEEIPSEAFFEFGDLLQVDSETILINCGFRSKTSNFNRLIEFFYALGFQTVAVMMLPIESGIIHLDLACHVVGKHDVLAIRHLQFLPLFVYKRHKPQKICLFHEFFKEYEYETTYIKQTPEIPFITNFINLNPETILTNSRYVGFLSELLKEKKIKIESVPINALENGNGSIHCLTLPLLRESSY